MRSLPCVDSVAPSRGVTQPVASDCPGIAAAGAVKVSVAAIPLAAFSEFDDGKVPGNYHGNDLLLSRLKSEAHCHRACQFFAVAYPRDIAIRQTSISGKARPNCFPIAFRRKRSVVTNLHSWRLQRGDYELSICLAWHASRPVAIKDHSFHGPRVHLLAEELIVIALIGGTLEIARERAEPADHVRPRQKNVDGNSALSWILLVPAIYSHLIGRLAVVI